MEYNITKKFNCLRCFHSWMPRQENKPRICPNCNSAYWDVPKKVNEAKDGY